MPEGKRQGRPASAQAPDLERLSVRFADGWEVVDSRAGSQSLREMVR